MRCKSFLQETKRWPSSFLGNTKSKTNLVGLRSWLVHPCLIWGSVFLDPGTRSVRHCLVSCYFLNMALFGLFCDSYQSDTAWSHLLFTQRLYRLSYISRYVCVFVILYLLDSIFPRQILKSWTWLETYFLIGMYVLLSRYTMHLSISQMRLIS